MKPQRDPATKPPISKYRAKTMTRTLMGQKLAEAINGESPGVHSTEAFNFVKPDHRSYEDEQYIK